MKSYYTRLLKVCRQTWSQSNPVKKECLKKSMIKVNNLDKFKCNHCKNMFAKSEINVDHVDPISNTIPDNIDEFIQSFLKLHADHLQILCHACHRLKTKGQMGERRRKEMLELIAPYMDASFSYIEGAIDDLSALKKFEAVVKKINESDESSKDKYFKKLDKLKELYL